MKSWNTHATYWVGILICLLIGSVSVEWNAIPDLPGIVSFALGLSSLLLAIIAIIQSLTANTSLDGSLAILRETASDLRHAAGSLNDTGGAMSRSAERNASELKELRETISSNAIAATAEADVTDFGILRAASRTTYGGSLAIYIITKAVGSERLFRSDDFIEEISLYSYINGFIACLITSGAIGGRILESKFLIDTTTVDSEVLRKDVLEQLATNELRSDETNQIVESIDRFFESDDE